MEVWKAIPGMEGYYEASTYGRIRGLRCGTGLRKVPRIINPSRVNGNYCRVGLKIGPKKIARFVHRLVLETFAGAAPVGAEAGHLDGSQDNNCPENLAWISHGDNMRHKRIHGTMPIGEKNYRSIFTENEVRLIRARHRDGLRPAAIIKMFRADRPEVSWEALYGVIYRQNWKHIE